MKAILKLILIVCFVSVLFGAYAQTNLQVVTKTIEKTLNYKKNYSLHINGEKAGIVIDTWEEDKISVKIELTAKHPELAVAEKDLDYFKYVSERIGKKIYLRNYISLPKGVEKPSSKYKARFELMVPKDCEIVLSNNFGNAQINDLHGNLDVDSKFCKLDLNNLQGEINIDSKFGDIIGDQLSGMVSINSNRSDITLSQLEGKYSIKSKYGVIKINSDEGLQNLGIDAEKTDIHFYNQELGRYQYALISDHGKIIVPDKMSLDFDQITDYTKKASSKEKKETTVSIHTSFGNIIIEEKEN